MFINSFDRPRETSLSFLNILKIEQNISVHFCKSEKFGSLVGRQRVQDSSHSDLGMNRIDIYL